jgi:hypothetical protein
MSRRGEKRKEKEKKKKKKGKKKTECAAVQSPGGQERPRREAAGPDQTPTAARHPWPAPPPPLGRTCTPLPQTLPGIWKKNECDKIIIHSKNLIQEKMKRDGHFVFVSVRILSFCLTNKKRSKNKNEGGTK